MSRKITRRNSFQTTQQFGDCWLYSTSTMTANYYLRCDLEINGRNSIFKDFDENNCNISTYSNYVTFLNNLRENSKNLINIFNRKKNCRSDIYYYFLFYFIYYIGQTTEFENIHKGNHVDIFEKKLLNILQLELKKYEILFYKRLKIFLNYLASFYYGTFSTLKKILKTIMLTIDNVNELRRLKAQSLPTSKFYYIFENGLLKRDILEKILAKSYLCVSYHSYIDNEYVRPNNMSYTKNEYYYPCLDKPNNFFVIINAPHAFVFEQVVDSIDDNSNNFGIVVKESNSSCKYTLYNNKIKNFIFTNFTYLKSSPNHEQLSASPESHSPPPPPSSQPPPYSTPPPPYSIQPPPYSTPPPPYSITSQETDIASGKNKKTHKKKYIKNKKTHKKKSKIFFDKRSRKTNNSYI